MTSSYLHFPEFDPVIFSIGPVALHWYGLMYLVGFIFAMWLATRRANRPGSGWTKNEVENLLDVYKRQSLWRTWLVSQVTPLLPVNGATQTNVVSSGRPRLSTGIVLSLSLIHI